jgi:hypothetical protein
MLKLGARGGVLRSTSFHAPGFKNKSLFYRAQFRCQNLALRLFFKKASKIQRVRQQKDAVNANRLV